MTVNRTCVVCLWGWGETSVSKPGIPNSALVWFLLVFLQKCNTWEQHVSILDYQESPVVCEILWGVECKYGQDSAGGPGQQCRAFVRLWPLRSCGLGRYGGFLYHRWLLRLLRAVCLQNFAGSLEVAGARFSLPAAVIFHSTYLLCMALWTSEKYFCCFLFLLDHCRNFGFTAKFTVVNSVFLSASPAGS